MITKHDNIRKDGSFEFSIVTFITKHPILDQGKQLINKAIHAIANVTSPNSVYIALTPSTQYTRLW